MKAVIIDDEPDCISVVNTLLQRNCPNVEVMATYTDPQEGLLKIQSHPPDILFLDIEMPRMNGFQLLDHLKELPAFLVFTTAYNEFAVKAFKYSALDYLLKPINPDELSDTIRKIETRVSTNQTRIELLQKQLQQKTANSPHQIALPHQNSYIIIDTNSILYCQSEGCYTRIFLENKEIFLISKSLGEVEDTLEHETFFRIHKQHLINIKHVIRYGRNEGAYVIMRDGKNLPMARSRVEPFKRFFLHF